MAIPWKVSTSAAIEVPSQILVNETVCLCFVFDVDILACRGYISAVETHLNACTMFELRYLRPSHSDDKTESRMKYS
jgi:hypothetical protein